MWDAGFTPAPPSASRAQGTLADLGSGRGLPRRAQRSGVRGTVCEERQELLGLCSLAAGDAPGLRSCRGCYPGGSRGRGADLHLRNGRSGASYGPAEAVSTSFAPGLPALAGTRGLLAVGE